VQLFQPPRVSSFAEAKGAVLEWVTEYTAALADAPLLENLSAEGRDCLNSMLAMSAYEETGVEYMVDHQTPAVIEGLEALEDLGLVKNIRMEIDHSSWVLAPEALSMLTLTQAIVAPRMVFEHPHGTPAITWTPFELMSFLDNNHWAIVCQKPGRGSFSVDPYEMGGGGAKRWFLTDKGVSKYYLCVLAMSEEVPGQLQLADVTEDGVVCVAHFQKDKYYKAIFPG